MAVNLSPPDPAALHAVGGIDLRVAMAGIKKPDRKDLLVMRLGPRSEVAGVFTQNRFCAAPVLLCRKHLKNKVRALVVNTGNANAGTGKEGVKRARQVCDAVAEQAGCKPDEVLPFATGAGPGVSSNKDLRQIERAVIEVSERLAQAIVRDGEGATKFITIRVERARSPDECRRVAYAIAHSPLVKTAFFASDPNLGRILAAIGNAPVKGLETTKVELYIDQVRVARGGARDPDYRDELAVAAMKKPEFTVRVLLHRGTASAAIWICDLSFDYVKINAEYRT